MEWIALLTACLLSMLLVTYPIFDFDFFWHLANGREMVNTGHIISKEVFSYTHPGEPFANHEWLSQIILYIVWHVSGAYGLMTFKLAVVGLMSWILFRTLRNEEQSPALATLLTVVVVMAGLNHYHVRPELFSTLFMALLGFILYGFSQHKLTRTVIWVIPLLMVLWDWLHGAVFGAVFLTMFVAVENIKHRLKWFRHQSSFSADDIRLLNICFTVTLIAMLIDPFGLRTYGMFIGYLNNHFNYDNEITEYTPVSWEYSKVFILMFAWTALMALRHWRRADITQLTVAMVFGMTALRFSRMASDAAIVMAPFLGSLLRMSMDASRNRFERKTHITMLIATGVLVLLYGCTIKFVPDAPEPDSDEYHYVKFYDLSFGYQMDDNMYPVGAVNFVKAHHISGNLYNTGNLGGYLSFHITPERKIFQYNMDVFGDLLYFVRNPDALEKWKINYAIVDTQMELNLFPESQWATVYADEAAVLLLRRTPQNAALIDQYEIHYFSPVLSDSGMLAQAHDPQVLPTLVTEMGTYLAYRKDRRVAAVWARILADNSQFSRQPNIQELLGKVLKFNSNASLQDLVEHT